VPSLIRWWRSARFHHYKKSKDEQHARHNREDAKDGEKIKVLGRPHHPLSATPTNGLLVERDRGGQID